MLQRENNSKAKQNYRQIYRITEKFSDRQSLQKYREKQIDRLHIDRGDYRDA